MLQQLLRILNSGSAHHLRGLAEQMGVSESLLESMLDELVRLGYLQRADMGCQCNCHACSEASTCGISGAGRLWTLSDAGRRMAAR